MREVTYTHKGWLLLCPIYLADIESDAPDLLPRWWILEILFDFSVALIELFNLLNSFAVPDYEPAYPMVITGELEDPLTMVFIEDGD